MSIDWRYPASSETDRTPLKVVIRKPSGERCPQEIASRCTVSIVSGAKCATFLKCFFVKT